MRSVSGGIFDRPELRKKLTGLEQQSLDPEFWQDPQHAQVIMRERNAIQGNLDLAQALSDLHEEVLILRELSAEGEEVDDDLIDTIKRYYAMIDETEMRMMLSGDHDPNHAILTIHPGAGGTESQDWAEMLFRMYMRYAEREGYKTTVLDYQEGDEAGLKSATVEIAGQYAYGYLKAESGVHRLVRISPFDAAKRRHTSFCSIHVTPEIEDDSELEIDESELRIDRYRASGAGGQHVNTTDSAIRITHIPTGIVVQCQNERSQHKNKASALKVLRSRLLELEEAKRQETIDATSATKQDIAWGSQIRSYVLHPYKMVKDHRTGEETGSPDKVLDGELREFVRAYLLSQSAATD